MFAFIAPGQGSQTPGMLAAWLRDPAVAERVRAWSEAADCDLVHLGTKAPAAEIARTEHTQPLLVAAGLLAHAALDGLVEDGGAVAAGHSVGELTAAVYAGVLEPADAVRLAAIRGRAMAEACAEAPTSMAAVVGGDPAEVLARITAAGLTAATFNGPGQIVAAGAVDALAELQSDPPPGATVKPLTVAGAFHTPYMESARQRVAAAAETVRFARPRQLLLSNADGALVEDPAEIRRRLVDQVVSPVRWDLCLTSLAALAPELTVSLPPAKTLASILKRQHPELEVLSLTSARDITRAQERLAAPARRGEPANASAAAGSLRPVAARHIPPGRPAEAPEYTQYEGAPAARPAGRGGPLLDGRSLPAAALVSDLIDRPRVERAEHLAVTDAEGGVTYRQLGTAVDRAVGWLRGQGIAAGDRVVYAGGNDRSFLALFWATLRIGAIFVPVHPDLTDHQVDHIVSDCEAALAICPPGAGRRAARTVEAEQAWQQVLAGAEDDFRADVPDTAVAMLIYTSGTTGRPKGVVCPHRQMLAALHAINERLRYEAADVVLCRLPLSFDYGLYQALLATLVGGSLVLARRSEDVGLLRLIERTGVTVVPLVPSLAQMLTLLQGKLRRPTRVRLFTNTGARPGRAVMAELLEVFPGSVFASMYGMTECKRISILDPAEYAEHPDSVGPPIPGDAVRIVGADGAELGPRETGEIVVWGPTVMAGYWRIPLEAQNRFIARPDGSLELHTGDRGWLDEDGRLYFVGRDDDVIKRRGIRLALTEIEDAAERIPGVTAAVALRPEPEDGPLVLAVHSALPPDAIRARLAERLDHARMPDQIVPLDSVPLTANGKPDRAAAKRLVDAARTAQPTITSPRSSHEPVAV
ncbi:AMP-binding protein [Kitasatospora sp. NPDC049285]|uniref:AMP-binding protein n=1 Tax=Kitasatospora sp. NPDC049285 TaxID=3157096 RepID=UPI003420B7CC